MQAKHTPGPWRAIGAAVHAPARHAASQRIADCRALLPAAELRANAALIAAAPDLLAMLEKLTRAVERLPAASPLDGLAEDARAVIARATGEA